MPTKGLEGVSSRIHDAAIVAAGPTESFGEVLWRASPDEAREDPLKQPERRCHSAYVKGTRAPPFTQTSFSYAPDGVKKGTRTDSRLVEVPFRRFHSRDS